MKKPYTNIVTLNNDIPELSSRYLNRELSWLEFNQRVLEEAESPEHPLLERIKFLAISAKNMDEFYMVRVAGLANQLHHNIEKLSLDGMNAEEQLPLILKKITHIVRDQQRCWQKLSSMLPDRAIHIIDKNDYTVDDIIWLKQQFFPEQQSHFTPVILRRPSDLPFIPNLGIAMVFMLKPKEGGKEIPAIVTFPDKTDRFIKLPSDKESVRLTAWENIISLLMADIFPDHDVCRSGLMRITRDSKLQVSDEADDLISSFRSALKKRKQGHIIRLKFSDDTPKSLRDFMVEALHIDQRNVLQGSEFLGIGDIMELYKLEKPKLKFTPHNPRFPERINDFSGDCFSAISAKDIIVHHPYETFDVVVQFIRQAARDPDVVSIKQTLYRTSNNSPIVKALIEAAEAGKDVTVVVELKARFDEEANLRWGQGLERAGANVIYGMAGLKTHAKISLVTRRGEYGKIQSYVHYGTGNYHPVTAATYSDLSFFTCNSGLCADAETFFTLFTNTKTLPAPQKIIALQETSFQHLYLAPVSLKQTLLKLIETESQHAKEGKPAGIWVKVNSLIDIELIEALYEASQAGVRIELIVRGICALRPGVPGLSDNIHVKSIVGRFLEHSRIFCFANGQSLPSPESKVFISSADWMPRNMERRIELMVPITNPTVHQQVLNQIMESNIKDKKQSWDMRDDGSYKRTPHRSTSFSAHDYFLTNPSLSGRGSALYAVKTHTEKRRGSTRHKRIAILDIGSNSVRMVIFDALKRVPLPLFNEKVLCGLARDLEKTGRLYAPGIRMAQQAIARFLYIARAMNIEQVHAFATSAVRDSQDGSRFVKAIEQRYRISINILTGKEEARLAALGIASALYEADGLVCDLGGGSLELAQLTVSRKKPLRASSISRLEGQGMVGEHDSFPLGALRLRSLTYGNRAKAQEIIDRYLAKLPLVKSLKGKTLYAVGGSFRAMAKIHLHRQDYPLHILEHYTLSQHHCLEIASHIASLSPSQIKRLPSVSEKRKDTLALSALVLKRLIELGKPKHVRFSTYGVREGLVFDMLPSEDKHKDALIVGCAEMISNISPPGNATQWVEYGHELFRWMAPLFSDEPTLLVRLRLAACILSRLAWYEHTEYRAEMAFRWMLDAEIPAISHWERVFVATAVYHRYKTQPNSDITRTLQKLLKPAQVKEAQAIGKAMRLGYRLSGSATGILPHITIRKERETLVMTVPENVKSILGDEVHKQMDKLRSHLELRNCRVKIIAS